MVGCSLNWYLVKDIAIPLISMLGIWVAYANARRDQNIDLAPVRVKTLTFWEAMLKVFETAVKDGAVSDECNGVRIRMGVASKFLDVCFENPEIALFLQARKIVLVKETEKRHDFALKVVEALRQELKLIRCYFANKKALEFVNTMDKFLDGVVVLTHNGVFCGNDLEKEEYAFELICVRLRELFPTSLSEMEKESWLKHS